MFVIPLYVLLFSRLEQNELSLGIAWFTSYISQGKIVIRITFNLHKLLGHRIGVISYAFSILFQFNLLYQYISK